MLSCLALAVLERAEAQITLGRLAEQIVLAAADPALAAAGVSFALERRDERTDLVAVVRLLLDLGVLARVAGDEDAFVREAGDALYDVDRRVWRRCWQPARTVDGRRADRSRNAWPRSPRSPARRTSCATERCATASPGGCWTTRALPRGARPTPSRLSDLASAARSPAGSPSSPGLVAEVRAEGIAMVDPTTTSPTCGCPRPAPTATSTLLLAEHLAARDGTPCRSDLHAQVRRRRSARELLAQGRAARPAPRWSWSPTRSAAGGAAAGRTRARRRPPAARAGPLRRSRSRP